MSKSIMSTVGKSGFELITIKDRVGCWSVQDRLCLIQTQLHQLHHQQLVQQGEAQQLLQLLPVVMNKLGDLQCINPLVHYIPMVTPLIP